MRTENRLREALTRMVQDVHPSVDAWDSIEQRLRTGPRPRPSSRLGAMLVGTALFIVALAVVWAAWRPFREQASPTAPLQPRLGAVIPLVSQASGIAATEQAVWASVPSADPGTADLVVRIDPTNNSISAEIPSDGPIYSLVADEGVIWGVRVQGDGTDRTVSLVRIDEITNSIAAAVSDVRAPIALGHGSVWGTRTETDPATGRVRTLIVRIDPLTMQMTSAIEVPNRVSAIASEEHGVWALIEGESGTEDIIRIDVATNQVADTIEADALYGQMVAANGRVWISSPHLRQPLYVDISSGKIQALAISLERFYPFAASDGGVWFAGIDGICHLNTVSTQVDSCTRGVSLSSSFPPTATVHPLSGAVWVANAESSVTRIDVS